ncbi:proliferating cell nuclear antigen (pcna) [Candidatus Woesearchaeota archaeon]|nr:proliferating cell nuclear antigen (pcna) [Candidatus Woesearchaeota archaeon]
MRLTLAEPRYLKESISIISDLVNEATFKVTPDAVELVAMDPANVAMIIFKLLSTTFSEYDVKTPTELAINLTNLKMVLKRAKPNDTLTLEIADNKLTVLLKGTTTRTFSIPIIELDEKEQRVPELTFTSTVKTNASLFNDAIEDAEIVAESVQFLSTPDKFTVMAEGDLSKAKVEMDKNNDTEIQLRGNSQVKAKYSIEYLKKMIAASKLADVVDVHFSKDYPLRLDYKVVDKLLLSFILAPRVENE